MKKGIWIGLGALALIIFSSRKAMAQSSSGDRGYINKNPGNIRKSNITYKGEINPSSDPAFKQFQSMAFGYRAMFKLLQAYINAGWNTINIMLNHYAPPTDGNHTDNYINFVSGQTGIDPDQVISINDSIALAGIVKAISKMENGIVANNQEVLDGYNLFLTA